MMLRKSPIDNALRRLIGQCVSIVVLIGLLPGHAAGDVIVLANRAGTRLSVSFMPEAGPPQQLTLAAGEVTPLFVDGQASVSFASPGAPRRYKLAANCAYYFGRAADGGLDLQKIGLGGDEATAAGRSLPGGARRLSSVAIPVKILVDEEEPGRQVQWERRLRRRIEAASAILEKHCRVGLRVVAVGRWNSDNATNDFIESLGEFEREVNAHPARLAIGFTSQWQMVRGRTHMAGTRGPLHSHILVREGAPQISEAEKLEFLVHEMGHYLGAAHSPERGSVMRPVLGDNLAGRSDFRIQFDPVNTLAIAMIGEEIRARNLTHLADLTPETKRRLRQVYTELSRSMPKDPAGLHYVRLMNSPASTPVGIAAKRVLQAIVRAAAANRALPEASDEGSSTSSSRRTGDELTEYYVRQAAREADNLPDDVAPRAFLVALGVGLGDAELLAKIPGAGKLAQGVESASERTVRTTVLGEPTMRERRDLAQHFFVSGYLTATMGVDAANVAGITKELLDAHGASGFSFADLAADRAGVQFGAGVLSNRFAVNMLAQGFVVKAFMPEIDELPEGLSAVEVASKYGPQSDPRFRQQLQRIDQRVQLLPPYRITARQFGP